MSLSFGVFDHLDASGVALGELYEQRLRLVEAYERAGLYAYHLAEHHATPLGVSPSPSVFLAAVAQRTRTIRFGPLVYTLALYHPLRLAEEICMLDHLSGGRFQLGVGRGVSPIEMGYYGVDIAQAQKMYMEAYAVIMQALTAQTLTHEGEFYRFHDVPITLHPLQRPHPPLWYGLGNPDGVEWCAEQALNVVSLALPPIVRKVTDGYRAAWSTAGRAAAELPRMGMLRHIVIADSDAAAYAIGKRAYAHWHASFWHLWVKNGVKPRFASYPEDFDALLESGQAIVGSPGAVRERLAAQIDATGVNYVLLDLAFGDLTLAESLRSLELFLEGVRPLLLPAPDNRYGGETIGV
jgi:alkanesulfonate monooxygenase SsuD/methylene tetrahydromethanopterin reductase-like flavin-dependent oxidoreductase (luciferase family)